MAHALTSPSPRAATDLLSHTSDWGVSVSEVRGRKKTIHKAMAIAAYAGMGAATFLAIPTLVGGTMFSVSTGVLMEAGALVALALVAFGVNRLSKRGPRNALEIDYAASEVRLGSMTPAGAFVRHRVCPFRQIEAVSVSDASPEGAALTLTLNGEEVTIRFARSDAAQIERLASKISAATHAAKGAPIRLRIQSRINGFEAGVREVGNRVRSRVQSRFA